jgi:hypothetical protein
MTAATCTLSRVRHPSVGACSRDSFSARRSVARHRTSDHGVPTVLEILGERSERVLERFTAQETPEASQADTVGELELTVLRDGERALA